MQMNNVPFDWKMNKLGHVADVFDGTHQTPEYVDHGIKFISAEDISDPSASTKYITHQAFENNFKIRPNKNDIFMTRIGRIGIPFLLKTDEDFAYYVTLALLKLKRDVVPEYLFYFIQGNYFQFELWKRTLHVAFPEKINKDEIGKCLVLYPDNITEQKKIAEILGTWDRAIEELTGLIAEKKKLKRGLMQRLLTGTQRLPGFTKPWQDVKLASLLNNISNKNKGLKIKTVLSVTNNRGFILPEEQFARVVASEDLSGYKIVKRGNFAYNLIEKYRGMGNFAYNPSRLNVGSIDRLDSYDEGVLSPMYVVFKCNEKLHSDYMKHWITTAEFNTKVRNSAQGSVRETVDFKTLSSIKIFLPNDIAEQEAIAEVLTKADAEIDLLNQQLDVLKEQKRGLMQKLLTGEIRVKVDMG